MLYPLTTGFLLGQENFDVAEYYHCGEGILLVCCVVLEIWGKDQARMEIAGGTYLSWPSCKVAMAETTKPLDPF